MRITYDAAADAVCIYLTGKPLTPGRTTIQAGTPLSIEGFIALDWKDGRLVGLEILDASCRCTPTSSRPPKSSDNSAAGTVPAPSWP